MNPKKRIDPGFFWVLFFIAVVSIADIAAAVLIRVYAEEMPSVAGDVSKVGIGALGGAAAAIWGNGHKPQQ